MLSPQPFSHIPCNISFEPFKGIHMNTFLAPHTSLTRMYVAVSSKIKKNHIVEVTIKHIHRGYCMAYGVSKNFSSKNIELSFKSATTTFYSVFQRKSLSLTKNGNFSFFHIFFCTLESRFRFFCFLLKMRRVVFLTTQTSPHRCLRRPHVSFVFFLCF